MTSLFLEKKTFYFSILTIWTNTDGKAHVLHKNNWLVNAKKCLDKVYLIDPRWDIKVITSNILWVILYVVLYSFSHNLPIHKHPLYTLSHPHQYTTLLQSLGAFGLVVFQNWNDDMKREFGVQLSLTWVMPGQWRWPRWCPAGTDLHTRVCWAWSGPVERVVGLVTVLKWILANNLGLMGGQLIQLVTTIKFSCYKSAGRG